MKWLLSLVTVFVMSACAHHSHQTGSGGGDCAHCKKAEQSGEKSEPCKGGCQH